jgi:hypothetical protein
MIKANTSSPKANTREGKGTKNPKIAKPPAAKPSTTKLSQLEALLRRPEGATIKQLVSALDWLPHSVRGAISGGLKKKRSLKIVGKKADGEERVYRIAE